MHTLLKKILPLSLIGGSALVYGVHSNKTYDYSGLLTPKIRANDWPAIHGEWDWNWDKQHPTGRQRTFTKRNIYLVRHGQYNMKAIQMCEQKLTDIGKEQARLTGKRLKDLGIPFTKIVVSTLVRAKQTAEHICKELGTVPTEETDIIQEGCPYEPNPPVSDYKRSEDDYFVDHARIESAFRKYFHRSNESQNADSHELFVCHANVIRYFIARALQVDPMAWRRFGNYHGGITHIIIEPDGTIVLRSMGDVGHLPQDKVTE